MKVIFDIDGTLTNFEKFVIDNSGYIERKYGLKVMNLNGYDIDELFDLKKEFMLKGYSEEDAEIRSEEILAEFWDKYYLKYCFNNFRDNVKETINHLVKSGVEVEIVSSRKKAAENNLKGKLVKLSTILSFKINDIKVNKFVFVKSDIEKINYIKSSNCDILVDDKVEIISKLSGCMKCICVKNGYNQEMQHNNNVEYLSFENKEVLNSLIENCNIIGHNISISSTEMNYKIVRIMCTPFVKLLFNPIVLNKENISMEKPLIYAPNHRKTLDPYFVMISSNDAIHWAALKRFFTGEDSIFNNSKNQLLCKLTSIMFRKMGFLPVDRNGDNTEMINSVNYYLQNRSSIGIFPEGTTNKHPEKEELLEIKKGVLHFSKDNNVLIQPVSIIWVPENKYINNKVIINYRKPISMENMDIEEGKEKWNESILEGIEENKKYIDEKVKKYVKQKMKTNN